MHEARLEAIDSSALQRVVRLLEGDCRALLEALKNARRSWNTPPPPRTAGTVLYTIVLCCIAFINQ